jgi:hypothetical protein
VSDCFFMVYSVRSPATGESRRGEKKGSAGPSVGDLADR